LPIIPCFPLFVNKSFYELFNIVFLHKNKPKHKMDAAFAIYQQTLQQKTKATSIQLKIPYD
ncbi:hypothetical protein, partial [Clostridium sp.]|uniref:hypothetical protein n=1 Tax=Clostridium sp. TaxID=1506 RepID=UPI00307EC521